MTLSIYTDGGARGNPGPAACSFIVYESGAGILRVKCGKYLGLTTNNVAEYSGVNESLDWLLANTSSGLSKIEYFLDSLLVINQLKGVFKIKNTRLEELFEEIRAKQSQLKKISPNVVFSYTHVPRLKNAEADLLVNQTLDETAGTSL